MERLGALAAHMAPAPTVAAPASVAGSSAPPLRVLVVGCGSMGTSHALGYDTLPGFVIVGLVSRGPSKELLAGLLSSPPPLFSSLEEALAAGTAPDVVSINSYSDTHEQFALAAFQAGAHVFLEKPIAPTVEAAERVVAASVAAGKKLLVGYILQVHPSWTEFIKQAQALGSPKVMRLNLNQQDKTREKWDHHLKTMDTVSPLVDCGVHYVDVMCAMVGKKPVRVSGIGARLTDDLRDPTMYNYGQLQVTFEDGSVGWYECGWGPMMSETAFFVKDVVGPKGSVSIVSSIDDSSDISSHSLAEALRVHPNGLGVEDALIEIEDTPEHDELCKRQAERLLEAITQNVDLSGHLSDAVESLRIVLAADESIRTGRTVELV